MSFLPSGYEAPAGNSKYMKFLDGDNKFRILGSAIIGWVDWEDTADGRKPIRTKDFQIKPAKHFWAFPVWDYQDEVVKILEVTQASIQKPIKSLIDDENWGDPKQFDITVKRSGKDLETEYQVTPIPPSEFHNREQTVIDLANIDLEKLYTNEDPFLDKSIPKTPAEQMGDGMDSTKEEVPFG